MFSRSFALAEFTAEAALTLLVSKVLYTDMVTAIRAHDHYGMHNSIVAALGGIPLLLYLAKAAYARATRPIQGDLRAETAREVAEAFANLQRIPQRLHTSLGNAPRAMRRIMHDIPRHKETIAAAIISLSVASIHTYLTNGSYTTLFYAVIIAGGVQSLQAVRRADHELYHTARAWLGCPVRQQAVADFPQQQR